MADDSEIYGMYCEELTKGIKLFFDESKQEINKTKYQTTNDEFKNTAVNDYVNQIRDSDNFKEYFKDDDAVDSVKNILFDDLVKYEDSMNKSYKRWKKIYEEHHKENNYAQEVKDPLNKSDVAHQMSRLQLGAGYKKNSKNKINSKKVSNKPIVSQNKHSIYKEIFGKKMKIYKMPNSRMEYVKYKGELYHISDYKDLMKQKAIAKTMSKTNK
jgi:hypothetical protein